MSQRSTINQIFFQVAGSSLFLLGLFAYFKLVTAPTRWVVWKFENLSQAFRKDSGKEVFRPEARWMRALAEKRSDKTYRLLGELQNNMYTRYPAVDILYPIRIVHDSPLAFALKEEPVSSTCLAIDKLEGIVLYECPIH